jgi:NADH-quinone oxidoreductase subunit K
MAQTVATSEVEAAPFSHMEINAAPGVQEVPVAPGATEVLVVDETNGVNGTIATTTTTQQVVVQPVATEVSTLVPIPMGHGLMLAGILFAIGLCGVMVRRNFLFMLMSLEIMMNAAALAFVVGGSRWVNPDGQVMFIFILTLAAAEAAIGLAILLQFYHKRGHLDVDSANEMKG